MTALRVGVVGVGALGRHHARIFSQLPEVRLVAVADPHETRGREVAANCGTRWCADSRALFGEVDAVSVVVPTTAHRAVASEFLERGIAVLVEKPLSADSRDADELVRLAEIRQALLQVGHVERFNPAWQAAAPHLRNPRYVRAERTSPYTFRSTDIGVVFDLMIHEIDLLLSLVESPVRRIEAFGIGLMGGGHEDAAQARIVFENGCIADLVASRVSPTVCRAWQVWTADGCTSIDLQRREVTRYSPSDALRSGPSPWELARQPGADIEQLKQDVFGKFLAVNSIPVAAGDALTAELCEFVECVRTGRRPQAGGTQAAQAVALAEDVLAQVKSHAWNSQSDGPIGPYPMSSSTPRKAA